MTVVVLAVISTLVYTSQAVGKERFDRQTAAECKFNKDCIRDLRRRQACQDKTGIPQRECYIRYAASYYSQPVGVAFRVARCESYPWLNNRLTSPAHGMWQFKLPTWYSLPRRFSRHSVYSPKYSSLGAMYFWSVGQKRQWECG